MTVRIERDDKKVYVSQGIRIPYYKGKKQPC